MTGQSSQGPLAALLPDLVGTRMLIIGAGGVGAATARLAHGLGVGVAVANRSTAKLELLKAEMADIDTHVLNARDEAELARVLDTVRPDHIVLTTGRVQGSVSGSIDLASAMEYVADRLEPIMAIANWIAKSTFNPRSFTIVSGFIGVPTMGNLLWSIVGPAIKGAMEHLAVELGPVRVNVVAPGPLVDTQMARDVVKTDEGIAAMSGSLARQLPIGRAVLVGDAVRQVMFVAGDPIATGSIRFTEGGLALVPGSLLKDLHLEEHSS